MWLKELTIVSFFPVDARSSEHWRYSPKQLLAEGGRHWGSMHTILCWEFFALMITFGWVSGTGPGGVWKAPHSLEGCAGILVWQPCRVALLGYIPAIAWNPCVSWVVWEDWISACILSLKSEEELCLSSCVSLKWLTSGTLNWGGFVSQNLNFSTVDWSLLTQH